MHGIPLVGLNNHGVMKVERDGIGQTGGQMGGWIDGWMNG